MPPDADPPSPHAPPPPPPPPASPSLPDVLALLAGPTDERRLVGLLLMTKLLPGVGDDGLAAARAAVGADFLERLTLPLVQAGGEVEVRGGRMRGGLVWCLIVG